MSVTNLNWNEDRNLPGEQTVTAALTDALEHHKEDPQGVKALLIILDDRGDKYATSFWNAGLKGSEMLALIEIFKQRVLKSMGVPPL